VVLHLSVYSEMIEALERLSNSVASRCADTTMRRPCFFILENRVGP
jgi:hypothetical protein